jgi:hypothetical protein
MSSGVDFIPTEIAELVAWQYNFVAQVNANKAGWNWNSDATAEWALLTGPNNVKQARFLAAYAIVSSKEFKHSDEEELKLARQSYISGDKNNPADTSIRLFIKRYLANNIHVNGTQKKALRITVVDEVKTAAFDPSIRLVGTQLALKKQSHLAMEIEVNYPGTKSKKKQKGVKDVMLYMLVQTASVTTIPDPVTAPYTYIGDMKRGVFTAHFTLSQEGMAALYVMRTKNTKGVLGNYTTVLRVVIS